jgi:quinol monooxygenase YgiN
MVRYLMSFAVPANQQSLAERIIDDYFDDLSRHGPGGMRSQCYATAEDDCQFVHIKSFKKESVANQHFRSPGFKNYVSKLAVLCGHTPGFSRLQQQQTFESIY